MPAESRLSRLPIVSSSDSRPRATSASAAAPLKAFETLAIRITSPAPIRRPCPHVRHPGAKHPGAAPALHDSHDTRRATRHPNKPMQ